MLKHLRRDWKDGILLVCAILIFLLALILPAACALAQASSVEEQMLQKALDDGEIIRLHIVANSDSAQDQAVKFAVRDAIIESFGTLLQNTSSGSCEAFEMLCSQKDQLEAVARCTATACGFHGTVQAQAGMLDLPEKRYGQVVLPSGRYRGVRITLGNGEGRNWWCVLYPQLCLALAQDQEPFSDVTWDSLRILDNWLAFCK